MRWIQLVSLFALSLPVSAGELWISTDLRSIELAPSRADGLHCSRLWIEERTWRIETSGTRISGIYSNMLRSHPITNHDAACRFPAPAVLPLTFNIRTWTAEGMRNGDFWQPNATPVTEPANNPMGLVFTAFTTRLFRAGDQLIDAATTADAADRIVFRRLVQAPGEFQDAVRQTIESLHSGHCQRIWVQTADWVPKERLAEYITAACGIFQRMQAIGGAFVSVKLDDVIIVDRVARAILTRQPDAGWITRPAYLVSLTTHFERQAIPGTALFTREENGSWKLLALW